MIMLATATVWFLKVLAGGDAVAPTMVCPPAWALGVDNQCHMNNGNDLFKMDVQPTCPDARYTLRMPDKKMCDIQEFFVNTVYFDTPEDCDAAGKKWISDLADTAWHPKRVLQWHRAKIAPAGASVTFTCIEVDRPR
jgi:hypothetical protein